MITLGTRYIARTLAICAAFLASSAAGAAEIKVIASNAVKEAYVKLLPVFEKKSGHHVTVDWGGTADIVKRTASG
jgi:molybdate transport system substrate-binding protein